MRKSDEIALPQSCWNKAKLTEILFVLLERDEAMAATIRFWAAERIKLKLNVDGDPQICEALCTANLLEEGSRRLFEEESRRLKESNGGQNAKARR